jgi:hypothetical protein
MILEIAQKTKKLSKFLLINLSPMMILEIAQKTKKLSRFVFINLSPMMILVEIAQKSKSLFLSVEKCRTGC